MKNICVIGTGYVGLVGSAIFADWGNNVVGVDIDEKKIQMIESGEMPIYEPGLSEIVLENIKQKRLSFTTSLKMGLKDAEIVFICVGTPQADNGEADLQYVWQVAKEIGSLLTSEDEYKVIVTKSTVPVGTNEKVHQIITETAPKGVKFDVASNPEFLREGSSVEDMRNTDRTIIGSNSEKALNVLESIYSHLNSPIVKTDLRSAELIKYASNTFLATKISFINEIAQICEKVGADVSQVSYGMGLDKRIGPKMLFASTGYGGSCFPKDVAALHKISMDNAYDFNILKGVLLTNDQQKNHFFKKITRYYGKNLQNKTFACLGMAFKYNTDDTRESIAIKIIKMLRGSGASIRAYDPAATKNAQTELGDKNMYYANSISDAIKGADALCILTEWKEFADIDITTLKNLKDKVIFDGRNMLDSDLVQKNDITYFAIGKPTNGLEALSDRL